MLGRQNLPCLLLLFVGVLLEFINLYTSFMQLFLLKRWIILKS